MKDGKSLNYGPFETLAAIAFASRIAINVLTDAQGSTDRY